MVKPYYGYRTKRYGTTHGRHDIELVVDKRVITNRLRLVVDGVVVDDKRISHGHHALRASLDDGTIVVEVDSGLAGELKAARLRTSDGGIDLVERDRPA
ncbi:MAG: hypothetical protein ACRCSN_06970 [Dermatophilaceae bacterium]